MSTSSRTLELTWADVTDDMHRRRHVSKRRFTRFWDVNEPELAASLDRLERGDIDTIVVRCCPALRKHVHDYVDLKYPFPGLATLAVAHTSSGTKKDRHLRITIDRSKLPLPFDKLPADVKHALLDRERPRWRCAHCNASSDDTDILTSLRFGHLKLCDDCVDADEDLSAYKWEPLELLRSTEERSTITHHDLRMNGVQYVPGAWR